MPEQGHPDLFVIITCLMMVMVYYTGMKKLIDKIVCGDCIKILGDVQEPFADLIFADPPFNIGYKYDKYNDAVKREKYVGWTMNWMSSCVHILKPTGSFYIAIGDEYAADIVKEARDLELHMRNWIIWHYTFGQQMKTKFARSHTHILYFTKDEKNFTFNDDAVRVLSDRQKIYKDKRANPNGKLPNDVWDEHPRICGTFKERTGWHPCQMPESILARIIRASSNEGDWVVDPFSGSGTTAVAAKKLGRHFTGIDLSKQYVEESIKRLKDSENCFIEGEGSQKWTKHDELELKWLYHENKITTETLSGDTYLLQLFKEKFNNRLGKNGRRYTAKEIKDHLIRMRKSGRLGPLGKKNKKDVAIV